MKILLIGFLLFVGVSETEGTDPSAWFVKTNGTRVYSEPSAKSNILFILEAGTPVTVGELQNGFYHLIRPDGREGWAFRFNLISGAEAGERENVFSEIPTDRQVAALEAESQSSIRGRAGADVTKRPEDDVRKQVVSRYADTRRIPGGLVDRVFSWENQVTPKRSLDEFLREGNLGEYFVPGGNPRN